MKLIIAGSRTIELRLEELDDIMEELKLPVETITEVVSGAAAGVDTSGELWAECRPDPLKITRFEADWKTHGKSAGPIRNRRMAEYADILLCVWDGKSRGSTNMIEQMSAMKKPIYAYIWSKK